VILSLQIARQGENAGNGRVVDMREREEASRIGQLMYPAKKDGICTLVRKEQLGENSRIKYRKSCISSSIKRSKQSCNFTNE